MRPSSTRESTTHSITFAETKISMKLFCVILSLMRLGVHSQSITSMFPIPVQPNSQYGNLVVDPATGFVYVGLVNEIYQLDGNLVNMSLVVTGPAFDNPSCLDPTMFGTSNCASPVASTNNSNQILAIDSSRQSLITCGTLYQGTCQIRVLGNITNSTSYSSITTQFVASNNLTLPTVGFVGPGPFGVTVLYVGSSLIGSTNPNIPQWQIRKYSDGVVSSRYLDNPSRSFTVFEETISGTLYGTRTYLTQSNANQNLFNYVSGFGVNGFSYFFSYSTLLGNRIVQVCQNDKYFDTYTDMNFTCGGYSVIQSAILTSPGSILVSNLNMNPGDYLILVLFSSSSSSAVCAYKLSDIRNRFTQNIQRCYNSTSDPVNSIYGENTLLPCSIIPSSNITTSFCGFSQVNTQKRNSPLSGQLSLDTTVPFYTFPSGVVATGIASVATGNHTVIFAGTSNGQLIKILVDSLTTPTVYGNIPISASSSAINRDMIFTPYNDSLYLMTADTIYKVSVAACGAYTTCTMCMSAGDPYCGWCTLQNSCETISNCLNSQQVNRWLSLLSSPLSTCPTIATISPNASDFARNVMTTFTVTSLPPPLSSEQYFCIFGSTSYTTPASYSAGQLQCPTPTSKPSLNTYSNSVGVNASVMISSFNISFVQSLYTFYSCAKFTTCTSCTSTPWTCHWCISNNLCQDAAIATSCSRPFVAFTSSCPSLAPTSGINIAAGVPQPITLMAYNLPSLMSGEKDYSCILPTSSNNQIVLPATRNSNTSITCSSYSYLSLLVIPQSAPLFVTWGNNYQIDNSYNITVFNCSAMSHSDCSTCVSLSNSSAVSQYGCVWCSGSCKSTCSSNVAVTCPAPIITSISPTSGPIEGGTPLTIFGNNLGYSFDQVTVTVGIDPCTGLLAGYRVSTQNLQIFHIPDLHPVDFFLHDAPDFAVYRIQVQAIRRPWSRQYEVRNNTLEYVCITTMGSGSNVINVQVRQPQGIQTPLVSKNYSYENPVLSGITPTFGPMAGGTLVTIFGAYVNAGANIAPAFGNFPCPIIPSLSNSSQIVCSTSPANGATTIGTIMVLFDGALRSLSAAFNYTPNPNITAITPTSFFNGGGCVLTVTGSNLQSGLNAFMYFSRDMSPISIPLTDRSSNAMIFAMPAIESGNGLYPTNYTIWFTVDNQTIQSTLINISLYSNPSFSTFPSKSKVYGGDALQLTGSGFTIPCVRESIDILVGTKTCNISSITDTLIYCWPPTSFQTPLGSTSSEPVMVYIGNLVFDIGTLDYQNDSGLAWQIALGAIGGVFFIVVIIIIIVFSRKSFKRDREYKSLQDQMGALESRVRNECRQAFADLQTDVSDFTSDIHVIGIPFWDYKMYTFKLLFPGINDHRILHIPVNPRNRHGGFDQKMHQFNQLLSSKYFLLVFIRTLERQEKEFGMKDRANVASLLMVILLNKMEQATDIVRILLGELIERSIEKKAPKLMLRRTESVVEKLLANWLSLAMYEHIKKQAGPKLFMLFKAIKHQTEKGPVDAVTSEAKHSLSEIRLLREDIVPKTITINVFNNTEQTQASCKILDCDTITQAKEKLLDALYKNMHYSKRPPLHRLEMVWKIGPNFRLPLRDEDDTTVFVNGWKCLNTIGHYKVPEGSVFELVLKPDREESAHQMHGMVEIDSGASLRAITLEVEGAKVCHLVKHDDSQNVNGNQKIISEIFLTRLLSTKILLQQYVDDLFRAIFQSEESPPPAVKYLYDFLDSAAAEHGISDPDVVHTWKSNSLPLRFWVNLITNPEFLFDVNKSVVVESCLSVIAQAFMESCSTHEHHPTKDAPTTKLLFAKDIPRYRKWVEQFYAGVKDAPTISDNDMNRIMVNWSNTYPADFNLEVALRDLYIYANTYKYELMAALDNDPSTRKMHFRKRFEQLEGILDGTID